MSIQFRGQVLLQDGEQLLDESPSAGHPLVIRSSGVVIGAVQPAGREVLLQPLKQRLVAGVHAQDNLRLAPVAPERTLADEQPDDQATLEHGEFGHGRVVAEVCFTVKKNVKRGVCGG